MAEGFKPTLVESGKQDKTVVEQLIGAFSFHDTHDRRRMYREISALSCNLSLLVSYCETREDFLTVWRYARESGTWRRAQALAAKLSIKSTFEMSEDPARAEEEVTALSEWLHECARSVALSMRPELMATARGLVLPVVDGQINGDIYGYAKTPEEAVEVASRHFAEEVVEAEFESEPFTLRDGTRVEGGAWVALTRGCVEHGQS